MAIRTFNSVGGFSVGELAKPIIDTTGDISNVANATFDNTVVVGNITSNVTVTKTGDLTATGNLTSNKLTDTRVTFAGTNGVLKDSGNLTFSTTGNILALKGTANIANDSANYVTMYGANGAIVSSGNANLAGGALTVATTGDVAVSNSFIVGSTGANGDSAFYVDAAGNFEIKIANSSATSTGGYTTVFKVDATSGDITTAGSVVNPTGGAATITAPGLNTQVLFNDDGNVGAVPEFTFDKTSNTLAVTGSANISDTLDVNGVLNAWSDIFIDGGNIYSPNYVVLPGTAYLYDGGVANSIRLHAETGGYAQLEYLNESNIRANAGGAFMVANTTQVSAKAGGNVEITNSGKTWAFDSTGTLSTPGDVYANAGNLYIGNVGAGTGGFIEANVLHLYNTANIDGDTNIDGTLTVANGSESHLTGNVVVGTIAAGSSSFDADVEIANDLHVYHDATVDGELTIGNLNVTNYVVSNLVPGTDADGSGAGYDLGSSTNRWKDLWLSGFTINLGNTTISSGGSNNMIVGNAVVGYKGSVSITNYTAPASAGNLFAGYLTTSNDTQIGDSTHAANLTVYGIGNIANTNTAISTTTGAFIVAGGVGIGGNIYVGGDIANITGDLDVNGAFGANIVNNLDVGGDANVHGNLVIDGDLTVSGTTTYVNTTNSSIQDALIDIGGAGSGANLSSGPDGFDRGLLIHNYNSGVVNQFMGWKQANSQFELWTNVGDSANVVDVSTATKANLLLGTLHTDHLYGVIETGSQPNITSVTGLVTANISGTLTANLANITTLNASGLHYPIADGSVPNSNEVVVLKTDGAANLAFAVIHTDRIANASSNVFVNTDGNVVVTANANATLTITSTGANITGYANISGALSAGSLSVGSLTPDSITLGDTTIKDKTTTIASGAGATVIAQVTAVAGDAVEFFVKGKSTSGTGYYTVATITAMYDGSIIDGAIYGKLHMGDDYGAGEFSLSYGGGKIQLTATPSAAASNVETVWVTQIRTV